MEPLAPGAMLVRTLTHCAGFESAERRAFAAPVKPAGLRFVAAPKDVGTTTFDKRLSAVNADALKQRTQGSYKSQYSKAAFIAAQTFTIQLHSSTIAITPQKPQTGSHDHVTTASNGHRAAHAFQCNYLPTVVATIISPSLPPHHCHHNKFHHQSHYMYYT